MLKYKKSHNREFPRNKFNNIFTYFFYFSLLWILWGWTTNTPDYNNYLVRFQYGTKEFGESGFNSLINFIKSFGVDDFQNFIKIVSFFYLLCLINIISKYTKRPGYVLFLFFLHPFIGLCSGIRYAFALLLIIVGLLVYQSDIKHKTKIFIIIIMVGFTFHYLSLFFLIMLFDKLPIQEKHRVWIIIFTSVLMGLLTYTPFYRIILLYISDGSDKIRANLEKHSNLGFIIPVMFHLFYFWVLRYSYKISKGVFDKNIIINPQRIYALNKVGLYIIPLYFMTMNFMRLDLPFFFINTLFYSEILSSKMIKTSNKSKLKLLNYIQYLYLFITLYAMRDYVWQPLIYSNEIITPFFQ